jgi:hypothetical protein
VTGEPPVPTAVYRYWVCDLRTGNKIAQLPLRPSGELPERIGDVSTASFACDQYEALKQSGDFLGITTPGRTMIIVEREYEGDSTSDILWAGIILVRQAGTDVNANLNCASIASYLNRRHVGTHTYNAGPGETDGQIITDLLISDAATEGLDFILDIDCPTPRAVRFLAPERKTVLQALQDLSAMDGGPEWTIKAQWSDASRTSVDLVFVARTRLGWAGTPNARFDFPGCITSYTVDDDFSEGHGANYVLAVNSSGGASDPARDNAAITQQGWPRWEELATSTSSDLNAAGLAGVAKAALKWRARGQTTNEVKVSLTYGPQYRRDLELGDNVTWFVSAPAPGEDPPSARHPLGHQETIRVIGISLDIPNDTYTPVLWNPYEEAT